MEASRRLTSWLRLVAALALALGLSSASAAAVTGDRSPLRESPAVTHLGVVGASLPTVAVHTGTVIRHAVHKHRLPATASGLVATALALAGVASVAVRRRRRCPALRDHALSDGARAPPALSDF